MMQTLRRSTLTPPPIPLLDVFLVFAALVAIALLVVACGSDPGRRDTATANPEADRRATMRIGDEGPDQDQTGRTLFARLGGEQTIIALVDDLTERVIADPRVNFARTNVDAGWLSGDITPWRATPENIGRFKLHMIEFLTLASGGPAEYTGRDMKSVHDGMRITNAEFDAMIGDVKASLDRLGIARAEARDVLAIFETTRKQVVEER